MTIGFITQYTNLTMQHTGKMETVSFTVKLLCLEKLEQLNTELF
jgi:hypothetical protein